MSTLFALPCRLGCIFPPSPSTRSRLRHRFGHENYLPPTALGLLPLYGRTSLGAMVAGTARWASQHYRSRIKPRISGATNLCAHVWRVFKDPPLTQVHGSRAEKKRTIPGTAFPAFCRKIPVRDFVIALCATLQL